MNTGTVSKVIHPRIEREQRTIREMVGIYCRGNHARTGDGLCDECAELLDYALMRLERCRYAHKKPTCGNCPSHCYKLSMKERVMKVMAYAGPRMSYRHPWFALMHFLDGFRPVPVRSGSGKKSSSRHSGSGSHSAS